MESNARYLQEFGDKYTIPIVISSSYANMLWRKKERQEKILEDLIVSSGLIDYTILKKAQSCYLENPYHNYLHALKITSYILYLNTDKINITEVRSLVFAALFHDAGRSSETKKLDEFISLDIVSSFIRENSLMGLNLGIVRQAIMGTVFSERKNIQNRYAQILSDCDIGVIGEDLANFCYYSIPLYLEFHQEFKTFITISQKNYIKYLMGINPDIIISEEVREILPNSYKTIYEFVKLDMETKVQMQQTLEKEDITLEEFREKFRLN